MKGNTKIKILSPTELKDRLADLLIEGNQISLTVYTDVLTKVNSELITAVNYENKNELTLKVNFLKIHGSSKLVYEIDFVLWDILITNTDELSFQKCRIKFNYLNSWIDYNGFKPIINPKSLTEITEIGYKYVPLNDLEANLDDKCTIKIKDEINSNMKTSREVKLSSQRYFELQFSGAMTIDLIVNYYVKYLSYLISFCINKKVDPFEIILEKSDHVDAIPNLTEINKHINADPSVFTNDKGELIPKNVIQLLEDSKIGEIDIIPIKISFFSHVIKPKEDEFLHPGFFLLNFRNIYTTKRWGPIFQNWFSSITSFEEMYDLFFIIFDEPSTFLQHDFLSLTQAMEMCHRRLYGGKYVTDQQNDLIKSNLIQHLPNRLDNAYRQKIKSQLRYANEYSQRKRFNEIFEDLIESDIVESEDYKKFVNKVVFGRNFLTHLSEESRKDKIESRDLVLINQVLRIILRIMILRILKLDDMTISEKISNFISSNYRFEFNEMISKSIFD